MKIRANITKFCHVQWKTTHTRRMFFIDVYIKSHVFHLFLFLQLSDWDRYAAQEYELLVAEESAAETAG